MRIENEGSGMVVGLVGLIVTCGVSACAPTHRFEVGMQYLGEIGASETPRNAVAAPEMLFRLTVKHRAVYAVELTNAQVKTCDGGTARFDLSLKYRLAKQSVYIAEIDATIPNKYCSTWLELTIETTRTRGDPLPETVTEKIDIEIFPR